MLGAPVSGSIRQISPVPLRTMNQMDPAPTVGASAWSVKETISVTLWAFFLLRTICSRRSVICYHPSGAEAGRESRRRRNIDFRHNAICRRIDFDDRVAADCPYGARSGSDPAHGGC